VDVAQIDYGQLDKGENLRHLEELSGPLEQDISKRKSGAGDWEKDWRDIPELLWKWIPDPRPYGNGGEDDDETLHLFLKELIQSYVDLTDPRQYDIIASFVMATWLVDKFRAVPYLYAVGPYGSGKSTLQEVLNEVCYKAVKTSSITTAALAGFIDKYHPTLLIDEAQIYNNKGRGELGAIVDAGYKRDNPRIKIVGKETRAYDLFGFKAFFSKEYPWESLASRCLIVNMTQNQRELEETLTEEFERRGEVMRSFLAAYRSKKSGETISDKTTTSLNASIQNGRVRELGRPLLFAAPVRVHEQILSFLKDLEEQHRSDTKTSDEAYYVQALMLCKDEAQGMDGKVSTGYFRNALRLVMERDGLIVPSAKSVSQKLKGLGLRIMRASVGTFILWDRGTIEGLAHRFSSS